MSYRLESTAFELWDSGLEAHQVLVLMALASRADDDGTRSRPGMDELCERARCSSGTVKRALAALERRGFISVEHRNRGGNRYLLHVADWPALCRKGDHADPLILEGKGISVAEKEITPNQKEISLIAKQITVIPDSSQDSSQDSNQTLVRASAPPKHPGIVSIDPAKKRVWSVPFFEIEGRWPTPAEMHLADEKMRGCTHTGTPEEWAKAFAKARGKGIAAWVSYAATCIATNTLSQPSPTSGLTPSEIQRDAIAERQAREMREPLHSVAPARRQQSYVPQDVLDRTRAALQRRRA